jgi:hypothetical protein
MFKLLNILYIDHYAVTTNELNSTLKDFLSLPGSKLIRGPGVNNSQGVNFAFVQLAGFGVVEILSPIDKESPILSHLSNGGGAYHLCYAVENIDKSIAIAVEQFEAKLIREPKKDDAFHGRRVAFLMHVDHGLFELLEAVPGDFVDNKILNKTHRISNDSNREQQLLVVFNRVMATDYKIFDGVSMAHCDFWDSLKHLMLIMAIENHFEVKVPAEKIGELVSLRQIHTYLEGGVVK